MVKLGIGESYSKVLVSKKIRAWLDLSKPASSVGIMLAIPFTALLFGELYTRGAVWFLTNNISTVFLASLTAFLLHSGSQSLNMAEDAYIDKQTEHKSNRPIPAGIVSEEEARAISWITIMVGVGLAFFTSTSFGVFAILLALNGVFYNLEPIRAKKYLWVNLVWQATSRGLLLYPAAFAAFGEPLNPVGWVMGFLGFLLVLSMQNTADFSDVEMDEEYNITTPAVYYGLDKLVYIMAGIALVMFSLMALFIAIGIIPFFWSLFLLAIPIGYSLWDLHSDPRGIAGLGENHSSWYTYYGCLASLYMLPAIQLILL